MRTKSWVLRITRALLAGLALGGWCQPVRSAAPETPGEASVKPGINAEFLKPEVDAAQWVERFEREGREIFAQRERIVEAVGLEPGQHVADIGAGSGLFTIPFAEKVGPRGRVYGVDIVPAFLGRIRQRAADAGQSNVRTILATERSVELPPGSIDLAFICDTYHHFKYPRQTLASIHRALKPEGEIVLIEFKRIPGESSDWVLEHVRAGEEVFALEIEEAGFRKIGRESFLEENYLLRFRRLERR